jgi:N-methylhydantoinase A/oxoprolinase/acetone carboxylase beta subunit
VDGRCIKPIRNDEILHHAQEIRHRGITTVIIVGVFSPLDNARVTQEEQVKLILEREIPNVDIVCSRDVGRVGFVERENAAILNGCILKFARKTISSFQMAMSELGLGCPLYLTQNDGSILDAAAAALTPIKTFSSGATVGFQTRQNQGVELTSITEFTQRGHFLGWSTPSRVSD